MTRRMLARRLGLIAGGERRDPAVRLAAGKVEHLRADGTEPDADAVSGGGSGSRGDRVVLAGQGDRAAGKPQGVQYVDRLADGGHGLARAAPGAAQPGNLVPGPAGPEAKLEPAAGEHVQARAGLGQHLGGAKRQVGDVGHEPQAAGLADEGADQGERIEKVWYVRVVLEGYVVESGRLRHLYVLTQRSQVSGTGRKEYAELQYVHDASRRLSMPWSRRHRY